MYEYEALVERVIDGDTVDLLVDLGLYIQHRIRVRLAGIDAPEITGAEAALGYVTKQWLQEQLGAVGFRVRVLTEKNIRGADKQGKYGRFLAHLFLPAGNTQMSLNQQMINLGLARKRIGDR